MSEALNSSCTVTALALVFLVSDRGSDHQ